jgi:hypothetical protein
MLVGVLDTTEISEFGRDFGSADFVRLVEAFGAPAWRCATAATRGRA